MVKNMDKCVDSRGKEHLKATLEEISEPITPVMFREVLQKLETNYPTEEDKEAELELLTR